MELDENLYIIHVKSQDGDLLKVWITGLIYKTIMEKWTMMKEHQRKNLFIKSEESERIIDGERQYDNIKLLIEF